MVFTVKTIILKIFDCVFKYVYFFDKKTIQILKKLNRMFYFKSKYFIL